MLKRSFKQWWRARFGQYPGRIPNRQLIMALNPSLSFEEAARIDADMAEKSRERWARGE